jgi:mannitol-1-phosphate 5-dehydrogenase
VSVDVLVEPFYEWVVDASGIKGARPEISGVTYVDDPMPYIERKLLTVNTGHSAIAYLGYARGLETIHAALEDPAVRDGASKALEETGLLLAKRARLRPGGAPRVPPKGPRPLREPQDLGRGHAGGARPIRKLGRDERFVSPALRLMEMGREPRHLAAVIRAVLGFDHPQDAEAVELQETIRAEGERRALARYAGVEEDHPLVGLVLESSEPARG